MNPLDNTKRPSLFFFFFFLDFFNDIQPLRIPSSYVLSLSYYVFNTDSRKCV